MNFIYIISLSVVKYIQISIIIHLQSLNIKFGCFLREGNDPEDYTRITYKKLLEQVCKCANVLKAQGVAKGDRVAIYMPMVLELVVTMLACSRIGAVHSIVVSAYTQ